MSYTPTLQGEEVSRRGGAAVKGGKPMVATNAMQGAKIRGIGMPLSAC